MTTCPTTTKITSEDSRPCSWPWSKKAQSEASGSTLCTMMTSSNGNIYSVTGPLWGKFTNHRWIPLTNASDKERWDVITIIMTSLWWHIWWDATFMIKTLQSVETKKVLNNFQKDSNNCQCESIHIGSRCQSIHWPATRGNKAFKLAG